MALADEGLELFNTLNQEAEGLRYILWKWHKKFTSLM